MNMVDKFIADKGGTAVDAIVNHGGVPENWPPSAVAELLSRLAVEIAKAEIARRAKTP